MAGSNSGIMYHLVQQTLWEQCKASNTPYYPPTYEQDGFTHLTADPALLLTVANHFYTDIPGEWRVLCIDAAKLTSKVVFEAAAPVGDKEGMSKAEGAPLFPHLYGSIDLNAVTAELPVKRGDGGAFLAIEGL